MTNSENRTSQAVIDERDELHVALAAREVEVEQLLEKIKELKNTVLYLSNAVVFAREMQEENDNMSERLAAQQRMRAAIAGKTSV
jgi:hypothetical protein